MSFAENLKNLRKRKGMTQKELANASGVSCSSIINYENGRRTNPPISVLLKLASVLDSSVDILSNDLVDLKDGIIGLNSLPYMKKSCAQLPSVDDAAPCETFIREENEQAVLNEIAQHIKSLNKDGIAEAVKRVAELTEIPRYRRK